MPKVSFSGVNVAEIEELAQAQAESANGNTTNEAPAKSEILLLSLEEKTEQAVENAIEALNANPNVEYAEPNYIGTFDAIPNDPYFDFSTSNHPYFNYQHNPVYSKMDQWNMRRIGAPDAWDIETGSADVLVGVIDSGVYYDHGDLASNIDLATGITMQRDMMTPMMIIGTITEHMYRESLARSETTRRV